MDRLEPRSSRTRTLGSVLTSIVFLAAGFAVYVFFVRTAAGQLLDASSFGAVVWLRDGDGDWAARLRTVLLVGSGALFVILLVIALLRKRVRDAGAALIICVIALLLSGGLKQFVVMRPDLGDFGYAYNTFPSGHETITVAALVGSYLLLPERYRRPAMVLPFLVLGTASGAFQVVAYAHRPSDVVGAALLVGAVTAWIPGHSRGIGVLWRWILWTLVAASAIAGVLCVAGWQNSHYATALQVTATLGIVLCTAAAVGGALIVGAERSTGSRSLGAPAPVSSPQPSS